MHPTLEQFRLVSPPREFAAVSAWAETFYDFQQDWLFEMRKLAAVVKCRQIGGSHTLGGAFPIWRGMLAEDTVLVSIRDDEAIDLLDQAEMHAKVLAELGSEWAAVKLRKARSLRLASGAEIRSTTSTAAGRGFTGNVVLDEFAYMQDQAKTWDAALAATMQGYGCRIISTPNGAGDIWHSVCTELGEPNPTDEKKWKIYLTTVHQAIESGMKINLDECWEMARHDPRLFKQLFEGGFLDGNFQYIPSDLLRRQTTDAPADPYAQAWAGLDIGETRDRTCLVIVRGEKGRMQVSHCETHGKTDDELIRHLISKAFEVHGVSRLCIDKTGMGTFPAQKAVREHGPKVEPVLFGSAQKEAMAGRLYQSLADGVLWLPKSDKDLTDDIMSIRRTVTEHGTVRFDAPRTAKGHADRAWALMLAVQASSLAGMENAYAKLRSLHVKDVSSWLDED
jgi:phage FluMu gp28-like protein